MERMALKPKLDFVSAKILDINSKRPKELPHNTNIMVSVIYDFIRTQRNDLGHPKEAPPTVSRNDAFVNLRLFPSYYKMVEQIIQFLTVNKV